MGDRLIKNFKILKTMAQFIVEVKEEYVQELGTLFGNPFKPAEAIQAALDQMVLDKMSQIIDKVDTELIAKKAEYETLYQQKLAAIKSEGGK